MDETRSIADLWRMVRRQFGDLRNGVRPAQAEPAHNYEKTFGGSCCGNCARGKPCDGSAARASALSGGCGSGQYSNAFAKSYRGFSALGQGTGGAGNPALGISMGGLPAEPSESSSALCCFCTPYGSVGPLSEWVPGVTREQCEALGPRLGLRCSWMSQMPGCATRREAPRRPSDCSGLCEAMFRQQSTAAAMLASYRDAGCRQFPGLFNRAVAQCVSGWQTYTALCRRPCPRYSCPRECPGTGETAPRRPPGGGAPTVPGRRAAAGDGGPPGVGRKNLCHAFLYLWEADVPAGERALIELAKQNRQFAEQWAWPTRVNSIYNPEPLHELGDTRARSIGGRLWPVIKTRKKEAERIRAWPFVGGGRFSEENNPRPRLAWYKAWPGVGPNWKFDRFNAAQLADGLGGIALVDTPTSAGDPASSFVDNYCWLVFLTVNWENGTPRKCEAYAATCLDRRASGLPGYREHGGWVDVQEMKKHLNPPP